MSESVAQETISPGTLPFNGLRLAVLIPCFNEGLTVAITVEAFRSALPDAAIYVYDNNSIDDTVITAQRAGAQVRSESRQGKGHVVRRMFADIEADFYILVDGDATYDANAAPRLVRRAIQDNLDFVNGARVAQIVEAYRRGHRLGNFVLTSLVRNVFGRDFTDMLSGFKIFSRRFVKSFPAMSRGFEIETELTVHALELRMPCGEGEIEYFARPEGSFSKLSTYRDGVRILRLIAALIKNERPLPFFSCAGALLIFAAIAFMVPIFQVYFETGLVPRLPTAVLSVSMVVVGVLSIFAGLILDMVATLRHETKRLAYLAVPTFDKQQTPAVPK